MDLQREPFSSSLIVRDQDLSFRAGLSISSDIQSTTFACRSSFSSFLGTPSTPYYESVGFSFQSSGGSHLLEIPIPVLSMPSFAFISPSSVTEGNCSLELSMDVPRVDSLHQGNMIVYSTCHMYLTILILKNALIIQRLIREL